MAFKIMNMWYQSKSINGLFIHLSDLKIAKQNNSMMCIFYSQQWLLFDVHSLCIWISWILWNRYLNDLLCMYLFVWYWSTLILPIYSNEWFCCEKWIVCLRWMDDDRIEMNDCNQWYLLLKWMIVNQYGFENHLWLWMWIYNLLISLNEDILKWIIIVKKCRWIQ